MLIGHRPANKGCQQLHIGPFVLPIDFLNEDKGLFIPLLNRERDS